MGPVLDCPDDMGTHAFSAQWAGSFRHFLLFPTPSFWGTGIWVMGLREKRAGECARGHVGRGIYASSGVA